MNFSEFYRFSGVWGVENPENPCLGSLAGVIPQIALAIGVLTVLERALECCIAPVPASGRAFLLVIYSTW